MTPDLVAQLLRDLMKEALILSAPILIVSAVLSFLLSLIQTLTSLQEQSLTTVPRLVAVAMILPSHIYAHADRRLAPFCGLRERRPCRSGTAS
jgi:flagellar biosynthesis protein FliQ